MTFSNKINQNTIEIIHNAFKIVNIKLLGLVPSTIANSIDYGYPFLANKKFNDSPLIYLFIDFGYLNTKISLVNLKYEKTRTL